MYRQNISDIEMGFNIPSPFYFPAQQNAQSFSLACYESEECRHRANCCIYIANIIVCLLGGSTGFIGANLTAKSLGTPDSISFAFGAVGMVATSMIGLSFLPPAPIKGKVLPEITRDAKYKLLYILSPVAGLSLGFLSAKSGDLIFESLGLDKGQTSSMLNIILAIMSGLSGFLALKNFSGAANQIEVNYDSFLQQQSQCSQFLIKCMSAICYLSSLVVISCFIPAMATVIFENTTSDIFGKITAYILTGLSCYGYADLYYNCFKMFTQKMHSMMINFGAEKFQNILKVIFGAIFLTVQSISNYGLGQSSAKSSALFFSKPESNLANIICGVMTVVSTAPTSILSGYAIAESLYKKSNDLYQYARQRFGY